MSDAIDSAFNATRARLATNAAFNVGGQTIPIVVGLITIPRLLAGLGLDRYGLLSIAWQMIGSFGLLDLGVGRAMTKFVADTVVGARSPLDFSRLVWTGLSMATAVGLVLATVVVGIASPLAYNWLRVPPSLQHEAQLAFYVLAAALPFVVLNGALLGVLEAQQRFRVSGTSRLLQGLVLYVGPLVALMVAKTLVAVMTAILVGRAVICVWLIVYCLICTPQLRTPAIGSRVASDILRFGSWITISNTVAPAMYYLDRVIVGAIAGVVAVAFYTLPYDIVLRVVILPAALVGVIFPRIVMASTVDPARAFRMAEQATYYFFVLLLLIAVAMATVGPAAITLWLGSSVSRGSAQVLQLLSVVALFNGLVMIPQAVFQAFGRPDITAKVQLVQTPVYLATFALITAAFGVVGAAAVAAVRSLLVAILFYYLLRRARLISNEAFGRTTALICAGGAILSVAILLPKSAASTWTIVLGSSLLATLVALHFVWGRPRVASEVN